MKRYLRPLYLLVLLIVLGNASAFSQATKTTDKSLLWRISSKEMKRPSYLFGTIHIICHDDYIWTEAMKTAFSKTDEVCFEMNIADPDIITQVALGMIDRSGKTLKDYFNENDYQKLKQYVEDSLKLSLDIFSQMKPIALQSILATKDVACTTPESYETNILQIAQQDNKPVSGLETVNEQLDLFDNLPVDSVIKDIINTINGIAKDDMDFNTLMNAYKKQDLPALYRLILSSQLKDKDLTSFLDVRNEKWIPRMVEKMDTKAVFFAVGAGHLPGDNGLISLLRKAGYSVEAIK